MSTSNESKSKRGNSCRVPWVDPNKPLPPWLRSFLDVPEELRAAIYTRNQRRTREYYLHLYAATPRWETRARIAAVYEQAHRMRLRGASVHVDHVVPLNSDLVCGLHTVTNLQIISVADNYRKSNRDFPGAPIRQLSLLDEEADRQGEFNI